MRAGSARLSSAPSRQAGERRQQGDANLPAMGDSMHVE